MAVTTLPAAPSSPTSELDSKPAVSSPQAPNTPVSPNTPAPPSASAAPQGGKRKPSRRANTAERRATHNAVERQRRETLNGRFLDLAALLPNLSQIRRPSKSSIVNSSIAHIHASRRHRILASRELRLLKLESDTFRRELNEWRERAGIQRIEEPVRGEGFSMIISAELEVIVGVPGAGEADDDDDELLSAGPGGVGYGGYVGGDGGAIPEDDYDMDVINPSGGSPHSAGAIDDRMLAVLRSQSHHQNQGPNPFPHSMSPTGPGSASGPGLPPHILPRSGAPGSVANGPTNVPAFEALYEHYSAHGIPQPMVHHHHHQQQQQQQQQQAFIQQAQRDRDRERELHRMQQEKMWGIYGPGSGAPPRSGSFHGPQQQQQWPSSHHPQQQQMLMQAQRSLFTPPATSHGLPTPSPTGSHSAGSPASSASGEDPVPPRSGSRSSRSPSYELGVGAGEYMMGNGIGEFHHHAGGHGHGHGQGQGQGGVPRMGGMMGMEMPLLGVGVGVEMS